MRIKRSDLEKNQGAVRQSWPGALIAVGFGGLSNSPQQGKAEKDLSSCVIIAFRSRG